MKSSRKKPEEFESKNYCLRAIKDTCFELKKHKEHRSNINHSRTWLLDTLRLLANDYRTATKG
jgi:hypothetical protein